MRAVTWYSPNVRPTIGSVDMTRRIVRSRSQPDLSPRRGARATGGSGSAPALGGLGDAVDRGRQGGLVGQEDDAQLPRPRTLAEAAAVDHDHPGLADEVGDDLEVLALHV